MSVEFQPPLPATFKMSTLGPQVVQQSPVNMTGGANRGTPQWLWKWSEASWPVASLPHWKVSVGFTKVQTLLASIAAGSVLKTHVCNTIKNLNLLRIQILSSPYPVTLKWLLKQAYDGAWPDCGNLALAFERMQSTRKVFILSCFAHYFKIRWPDF